MLNKVNKNFLKTILYSCFKKSEQKNFFLKTIYLNNALQH